MSEARQIQLWGGPRDGETIVVRELCRTMKLLRDTELMAVVMTSPDAPASTFDALECDVYELMEKNETLVYVYPEVAKGLRRGMAHGSDT